ncbi:MAG TPA: hypothetical protein VFA66_11150 [Gaiellaceae bacterium]|nr:hypothetical protein [Gaiellaceae bacterium]
MADYFGLTCYAGGTTVPGATGATGYAGSTAYMGAPQTWRVGPGGRPYESPDHHHHQAMAVCPVPPSFQPCHAVHGPVDGVMLPVAVVSTLTCRVVRDSLPRA